MAKKKSKEDKLRDIIRSKKSSDEERQTAHCQLEKLKDNKQWANLQAQE